MNRLGLIFVFSAVYLSLIVALVISINENETPRRIVRETGRRALKLLGVLLLAGVVVEILTYFSGA